jgi:predicted nuclease with TOPRIM domain
MSQEVVIKELEKELHRAWDEARDWKANVQALRKRTQELEQEGMTLEHRLRRETATTAASVRFTRTLASIMALAVMLWCILG